MRTLGQREDGTEIGAWVLVADPDAWDLDGTEDDIEIERWPLTNDAYAPLMRAGDPCVIWVTPSTSSDTGGGLWAVGELAGEAFDEARSTYVEVSVHRLRTPVPPQTFRNDPDLAAIEVLDHDGAGNPLTLTPHEYAEIEDHLDELDLWPDDPETDALLDAAEDAALASLENLGWSLEDGDEGALLATKGEVQREVFVAIATEEDGFILGVEELDELLWDGDPLLLVVVEFVDREGGDGDGGGGGGGGGADAQDPPPEVIKVDEHWVPTEADYDRRTQIYHLRV